MHSVAPAHCEDLLASWVRHSVAPAAVTGHRELAQVHSGEWTDRGQTENCPCSVRTFSLWVIEPFHVGPTHRPASHGLVAVPSQSCLTDETKVISLNQWQYLQPPLFGAPPPPKERSCPWRRLNRSFQCSVRVLLLTPSRQHSGLAFWDKPSRPGPHFASVLLGSTLFAPTYTECLQFA